MSSVRVSVQRAFKYVKKYSSTSRHEVQDNISEVSRRGGVPISHAVHEYGQLCVPEPLIAYFNLHTFEYSIILVPEAITTDYTAS